MIKTKKRKKSFNEKVIAKEISAQAIATPITKQEIVSRIILDEDEIYAKALSPYPTHEGGEVDIKHETELGQSLKELNKDNVEYGINMTSIDLRSRLHYAEIIGIVQYDFLIAINFLPLKCLPLTRIKKRDNVSLDGKGREEIVDIVAGKRAGESPSGFWSKLVGGFGGNKQ